ncbi:glycoside hydrolase family 3 C-terminal domain-containing protein [uncultured Eubacterium sp.]|uniref:glycoside hydrolase family 3 protein n=1 Tax=uncultured Eubacterium sp. TaxID=165185 RepID=UPI0025EB1E69|nr:glycoside hydrolase family 3 protein [uncultured Eubacterium sp.]
MTFKEKFNDKIGKIVTKFTSVSQDENGDAEVEKTITDGMPELARQAAAEGAVLLKNDNVLPLKEGTTVSLFGRTYKDYFFVGYGSGGDVIRPYNIDIAEGIENCDKLNLNYTLHNIYMEWREKNPVSHGYWAHWPLRYEEMPLTEEIVASARTESDTAVVTIGRSSGEDRDCDLANGSYYLDDEEIEMLDLVTAHFEKVIVILNVGNIIDMSWVKHYGKKIGAVIYAWQGGMESGNAVADLLCGNVNPCGRLTDTIAKNYYDYPSSAQFGNKKTNEYTEDIFVGYRYFESFAKEKVLYPFGFGLSYTDFDIKCDKAKAVDNGFEFEFTVTNTGEVAGKEVVQLYLNKPCGKLGNPKRELVGFAKTELIEPNDSQKVTVSVDLYQLTSYDDCGSTNNASSYVTQKGEYDFYVGKNVRDTEKVFTYYQENTELREQLKQVCAPKTDFLVWRAEEKQGNYFLGTKMVAKEKYDLATRILNNLPADIEQTGDKGIKLQDVKDGKATLDEFVAQLDNVELEAITRGDYKINSPLGAPGNVGAYGGVLESLRDKGIKPICTTDGPSGIRLVSCCSLLPIGTLLACTFNTELVEKIYTVLAGEMKEKGSDVLLAPGMNIHRNPLCGRNFEYFSEDPYLSGKMGSACVKGIQSLGASACPKHFACNNQELARTTNNSQVSERALREIYLKPFEICIKEAKPKNIMTSYNKINGVWSHYNYDTCVTVLRREWGYEGNVMTDWWMHPSKSIEFPKMRDQAYRVRSGVNLLMPGGERVTNGKPDGTLFATLGKPFGITVGEVQQSAKWILKSVMEIE